MSNCLVTTLKESVTDTDLLKLGEIKFKLAGDGVKTLGLRTQPQCDVSSSDL